MSAASAFIGRFLRDEETVRPHCGILRIGETKMTTSHDFYSTALTKNQIAKLFGVDAAWIDAQIEDGGFPPASYVAGKPIWNGMNLYHWWAEIYLEPECCDDEHGRKCTAAFDRMLSDLFND
jgi:hypothetical protein